MVCIDLIGRFSNNLFQIAMAVGYADKHNVDYVIPQWEYSDCFKTVFTSRAAGNVNWGENGFAYQEIPFIENVKLFGYFQSEKYFKHCESKIRDLFQFNDRIREKMNIKYADSWIGSSTTCSIHIRRGDYIGNGFHEVCHIDYYQNAINEMKNRAAIETFVVFSDDPEWCKQNLKGDHFLFVEGNSNVEDMYLMTQCHHNIICNSSFSWWGAWLNANKEKIVVAPDKWFNDTSWDTKDLIPECWIKIKIVN